MSEYRKWYAGNHHMITEAAHNSVVELEQQLAELEGVCDDLLANAFEEYYPCVHEGDLDRIAVLIGYAKDWRRT